MKKILLIEDDELMIKMYQRYFVIEGFTVEIAENGLIGLEKAKTFKPDIILLDIMMPELNGLQTLEKLKQDSETKNIKVFMLTNLVNKQDADSALAKGAIKYFVKSEYEPKQLLAELKQYT